MSPDLGLLWPSTEEPPVPGLEVLEKQMNTNTDGWNVENIWHAWYAVLETYQFPLRFFA